MADFPSDTRRASAPRSAARSAARKRKRTRQEKGVGRRKKKEPPGARKRNRLRQEKGMFRFDQKGIYAGLAAC